MVGCKVIRREVMAEHQNASQPLRGVSVGSAIDPKCEYPVEVDPTCPASELMPLFIGPGHRVCVTGSLNLSTF